MIEGGIRPGGLSLGRKETKGGSKLTVAGGSLDLLPTDVALYYELLVENIEECV